jgi:hypothetical protein
MHGYKIKTGPESLDPEAFSLQHMRQAEGLYAQVRHLQDLLQVHGA